MPEAKAEAAFGIINGHFYVGGGSNASLRLYDYDIAANSWTRRADLLRPTYSTASAAANGQLKIFGGRGDLEEGQTYDPAANTWSSSSTSFYAFSPAVTSIGNTFFACGGEISNGMFGFYSIADTETSGCPISCEPGLWKPRASYPVAMESPATATDGTSVYSAGGLANGVASSGFYRFNATADAWTALPSLPAALYAARGAYAASTHAFYVFGGRDGNKVYETTYKYNINIETWTTTAPMPAARYAANVVCDNVTGKIFVIGGFDAANNESNQTWEYDPVANSWNTSRANMPMPMAGSGTSIVGQFIYLVGSWNGGIGSTSHQRYDIINDIWEERASPPVALYNAVAAATGGRIYLMGAPPVAGGSSAGCRFTYVYDIGSNSWTNGLITNAAHASAGGVAVNGQLLLIAGSNKSGTDTSAVESLAITCSDCATVFNENFDSVTPPALPNGWTATNVQGSAPLWTVQHLGPAINAAYGATSTTVSDKLLISPPISIPVGSAQLNFLTSYNLETPTTGVLEVSSSVIEDGTFLDVTDTRIGGRFINGAYNELVSASGNPLFGRQGWSGSSGSFTFPYADTVVDLGPKVSGHTIQLRFRLASSNVTGGDWLVDNVAIKPLRCAPTLVRAVSRKVHGEVGAFDIDLPLTGAPGVECRTGAVPDAHQIVLIFANSVAFSGVSVTAGTGSAAANVSGTEVTVDLTGVANAQTIMITLANVDDGANYGDVSVPMRVLAGDVTGNRKVNASDVTQTKAQSGQPVSAANFRTDVNTNGSINSSDITIVKSRSGTGIP